MLRGSGILCGFVLTVGALAVGSSLVVDAVSTPLALMLIFVVWGMGWLLGPVQTGGDGFLRPEWFSLLPGSRTRLAISILLASCTGYGALFTLGVTSSLAVYAAQHGVRRIQAGHKTFAATLGDAILGGEEVVPASAAVSLRSRAGDRPQIESGTFLEADEAVGGFYLIEADSREEAVRWAALLPETAADYSSGVEVREVVVPT